MLSACIDQAALVRRRRQYHCATRAMRYSAIALLSSITAAILLLASSPFLFVAMALGARIRGTLRSGRLGRSFTEYELIDRAQQKFSFLGPWLKLWNIMRGELSWVGPQARCPGKFDFTGEAARRIATVSPGLICTWWVRQRTNIAYTRQLETDLEYVETHSMRADIGITIRALLAFAYGRPGSKVGARAQILGLPLDNLSLAEAVEEIVRPREKMRQVSFINVDCVNLSFRDAVYRNILRNSDLRLADGIGLRIAGRLLQSEIRQNVNGTDLFPVLCDAMENRGLRMFLLGGRPGVAADVASRIKQAHPHLVIAGTHHGYFPVEHDHDILAEINASGADVLLVAFGAPTQEKWIARHRDQLGVRAALGVGGLFDFYSGRIPRAPQWLREVGLEWTYRLYQEPRRMWRRYLVGNVVFLARVLFAKLISNRKGQKLV